MHETHAGSCAKLAACAPALNTAPRLAWLVDMRGIGLVTGDSGSGKTTTCRHLVAGLHTGLYRVLHVSMTTGNAMDLYKSIAWELGLPTERNRAALFKQIRTEVSRLRAENRGRHRFPAGPKCSTRGPDVANPAARLAQRGGRG